MSLPLVPKWEEGTAEPRRHIGVSLPPDHESDQTGEVVNDLVRAGWHQSLFEVRGAQTRRTRSGMQPEGLERSLDSLSVNSWHKPTDRQAQAGKVGRLVGRRVLSGHFIKNMHGV